MKYRVAPGTATTGNRDNDTPVQSQSCLLYTSGVLYARDFLLDWTGRGGHTVRELMRPAYLVPDSLSAGDLLRDMQRKKIHLAVDVYKRQGFCMAIRLGTSSPNTSGK